MREGRDGWIDEVPCAVLPILALLCHAHAEIGDFLNHLSELLSRARLGTDQLPCACLQRRCVPHKHDVSTVGTHCLENEASDVVHALIKLQVCFIRFEIVQRHLGQVSGVYLESLLV